MCWDRLRATPSADPNTPDSHLDCRAFSSRSPRDNVARKRHGFTRIRPASGKSWPELGEDGLIRITLSAGLDENDPDLAIARAAILVKTASLFENREGAACLAFDTLVGQLKCRWI